MPNKLTTLTERLVSEAKSLGESEFATLAEFFDDLAEDETNVQVFIAACDQFISHAQYIKKELSKVKGG